jgi:effector-binding domain-containing protein
MILLLRTFGVALKEITKFVNERRGLYKLFKSKQLLIKKQISELQAYANNIDHYMENLTLNGTMIRPSILTMKPFLVYYVERVGSYSQIGQYCAELSHMLVSDGKEKLTTMAIFDDPTYQPKQSRIRIAVLAKTGIHVKKQFKKIVKRQRVSPGKVITWTHNGSGSLLSLFWKELEKYCRKNGIRVRKDVPDFEIYREVSQDATKQFFEIYLPIE